MPFLRYTRDKRGYETTLVMHAYRAAAGPQRTRVLYLFRSPANLKVGRRPLDAEVVEALEHTHPDLSFDWTALRREPVPTRLDPAERGDRRARRAGRRSAPAEVERPVVEDQTPLGRVLGAAGAARLRARYQDLLDRIGRRARTPDDRDRLTELAGRLNPDEWVDEAAVRAGVATVEAQWRAVAEQLPARRRGRRGGHRAGAGRAEEAAAAPGGAVEPADPSGIMDREDTGHVEREDEELGGPDRAARPDGDRRRDGSDPSDAGPAGPAGDLPGGD